MNRKKYALHSVLLLILVITCASSCSTNNKVRVYYMKSNFRNYFHYNVGSYWVFIDSVNSNTDSLYVVSVDSPALYPNSNNVFESRRTSFLLRGLLPINDTLYFDLDCQALDLANLSIDYRGLDNRYTFPMGFTTGMPFEVGQKNISGGYGDFIGYKKTTLFDNVTFSGKSYNEVYKIEYYNTVDNSYDVFYINKEVGFLAILLNNTHRHNQLYLKASNVIK